MITDIQDYDWKFRIAIVCKKKIVDTLNVIHHPVKSGDHRRSGSRVIIFLVCQVISQYHVIKETCDFMGGSLSGKSPPYNVWWPYSFWLWRYNVVNFSSDLARPSYLRTMWLHRKDPHKVSYHPAQFGGQKHFDSGDITFLVCHVISQDRWT